MNQHIEKWQELGFPNKHAWQFPPIINIEVLRGKCPCLCVHCPLGLIPFEKRKSVFDELTIEFDLFKKIVDETADFSHSSLRIHSVGEPLLWTQLANALKYAHSKSVKTWLFTCAITDDTDLLEKICQYTSIIEVSVNSISSEDYQLTKGVNAFELVESNLKKMRYFIQNNALKTRLIVSRVQSQDPEIDKKFVEYWKSSGLVDDAFIRSYHTYNDLLEAKINNSKKSIRSCLVHWARFNISVKGDAVVCFNELFKKDLLKTVVLGNLITTSIQSIWHSVQFNKIRNVNLSGEYGLLGLADNDYFPCEKCTSCQPINSPHPTSEKQIELC